MAETQNKRGFQKNHVDFVPVASRKKQAEKMKKYIGDKHWSTGKKLTIEHRKKLVLSHIGQDYSNRKGKHNSLTTEFKTGTIPWSKGTKGIMPSGENHPRWIADRTLLKKYEGSEEKRSPAYKSWHKQVKDRDNWSCRIADNNCDGRMEAHHILGWTAYPELRYEVNNGITLCHFHHPRKRNDEMRLSPYFQSLVSDKVN